MTEEWINPELALAATRNPRGLGAGALMLVATVALVPFAFLSPYLATELLGFIGAAAVFLCIRYKYRGRLAMNLETCFLLGTALQYLLAPALMRLISGNFKADYWRDSAEHAAVKDFYGPAMAAVLLFLSVFMIVSGCLRGPRGRRELNGRILAIFSKRTAFVLSFLILSVWSSRLTLLANGAYYHQVRSHFRETGGDYSALTQTANGGGFMVVAFFWTGVFSSGYALLLAIPYTILDLSWNAISGSREPVLIVFIVIGLTYYICRNRIPWKYICIVSLPVLMLAGYIGEVRSNASKMAANRIDLGQIFQLVKDTAFSQNEGGGASFLVVGISRFNDLDSIAAVYEGTPSMQPYLYGETYLRVPEAMVPRALWKEKPQSILITINEWFFHHDGGSSPITVIGEGFLNFGWVGVALHGVVCALIVRFVERVFSLILWNGALIPVYVGSMAVFARLHTEAFVGWFTGPPKMILFAFFLHLLTRPSLAALRQKEMSGDSEGPLLPAVPLSKDGI